MVVATLLSWIFEELQSRNTHVNLLSCILSTLVHGHWTQTDVTFPLMNGCYSERYNGKLGI